MNSRRRIGPPVDVHRMPAYNNSGSMLTGVATKKSRRRVASAKNID
jgi:hypothetical protein